MSNRPIVSLTSVKQSGHALNRIKSSKEVVFGRLGQDSLMAYSPFDE